jgi:hypothetical protein
MWDDRLLFVIAAMTAIAIIFGQQISRIFERLQQTIRVGRQTIKLRWIIVGAISVLLILVIGRHIWSHRHQSTFPNATSLIAIVLGAIFGSFTARFVASLFHARFGARDPLIGASVLVLLIIAYSLPLYSSAISELISGIGLSSVKTPFLELTMRERGNQSVTAAASGTASNTGQVPRVNDPRPGLNWLTLDTILNADPATDSPPPSDEEYTKALKKALDSTLLSDEDYIGFFEKDIVNRPDHIDDVHQVIKFLTPSKALSKCLEKYISVIPDSGLLLVDVKPVIESMFILRARAKIDLDATEPKPDWDYSSEQEGPFLKHIRDVLGQVDSKFEQLPIKWQRCELQETPAAGKIDHRQPYTALVLADLIHAHGSPDEAIGVLAEWLDVLDSYRNKERKESKKIPKWWELRVMSRISILMAEVAGQNNLAYREFFGVYKKELENYFAKENITLAMLKDKCKSWPTIDIPKFPREISNARSTRNSDLLNRFVEQKAFYLLLAAEDEALRTEVNFVGEEGKIERLENLYDRATFLGSIGRECLPRHFDEPQSKGIVADQQVTAGLLELTIADRIASVAVSRGDRDRAGEIAKAGANALREGYAALSPFIEQDRRNLENAQSWNNRVFPRSDWEKSASLAERAFLRLRTINH